MPVSLEKGRAALKQLNEWFAEIEAALPAEIAVPEAPRATVGLQNPTAFYEYIRGQSGELFPTMSQSQFDGVEATLHTGAGVLPLTWMAYVLATEYHETAKTMQGVKEGLGKSEEWRKTHLSYYPWYGRGKVQLTWEDNYKLATEKLTLAGYNVDLIAHPDQALDLEIAAVIIVVGMLEGWFTGKKLNDYINNEGSKEQFVNARKIVNGTDKADLIAGYATEFKKALQLGDWK